MASHVEYVLTPEGLDFMNRLRKETFQRALEEGNVPPTFPISMPKALREEIKRKAKAAGANLMAEAEHGLKEYLAGRFTPAQPRRAARGSAVEKANLNLRVDAELRRDADALSKQLLADGELDWAPLASHVITSWFTDRVAEDFRCPVSKRYAGRELWTAERAAEARGVSAAEWLRAVEAGSAARPLWVTPDGISLWDPADVAS